MYRVRFAPSPTGNIHIGNVRAALFNYVFAQKEKGKLILRIEDTDLERSSEESIKGIIEDLSWLGINFDEGPKIGGEYAPYKQTQRLQIYKEYAEKLLKEGKAEKDFSHLTEEELKENKDNANYAIRLKTNKEKVKFKDIVFGEIEREVESFIILKSNSIPTYHLGVVVDDYLMKISHVIRGQDHLGNTAKHILLARKLRIEPPKYAHFSLTKGLSKRDSSKSIKSLREKGYLPESIINMAMLLGWAPKDEKEKFNIFDKLSEFKLKDFTKVNALFDEKKFNWLSAQYIREANIDRLFALAQPYLIEAGYINGKENPLHIKKIIDTVKGQLSCMSEITEHTNFFFNEPSYSNEKVVDILKKEDAKTVIALLKKKIENEGIENISPLIKSIQKETGIKGKNLFMPIRAAITGELHGPELGAIIEILGKETVIKRLYIKSHL